MFTDESDSDTNINSDTDFVSTLAVSTDIKTNINIDTDIISATAIATHINTNTEIYITYNTAQETVGWVW